jgi:hypothetical protein
VSLKRRGYERADYPPEDWMVLGDHSTNPRIDRGYGPGYRVAGDRVCTDDNVRQLRRHDAPAHPSGVLKPQVSHRAVPTQVHASPQPRA